MISHIVAVAKNDVIGSQNELPWDIPEDMKFFKDTTSGQILIMGRKTFESVGHPLPNRLNLIVTRQKDYKIPRAGSVGTGGSDVRIFFSLEEALAYAKKNENGREIFIIGGGEIFKQSMNLVDRIYLTRIHRDFDGDITYPKINMKEFKEVSRVDKDSPVPFSFFRFERA